MNIIKTKVDFTKGTCTVSGINLVEGDYNSTKIEFTFDREDGTKVFEMKSPSEQLVAYQEIYNNEIILYGLKDVTTEHNSKTYTKYTKNDAIYWYQLTDNKLFTDAWVEVVTFDLTEYTKATEKASIFTEEGNYIFEISLYEDDSKLTSASGKIKVKAEQVKIDDNMVTPYIPIFDELMQDVETALGNIEDKITEVNTAIIQTNNLDLDVSKSGKVATVTLTKKDNTTKTVTLSDGTSLQFNWDGTKLGVKTDNDESYTYVDLKGETGETGATPSLSIGTVSTGSPSAVTITGTDENPVLNFTLEKGETGATGATGNGIASIVKTSTSGTVDTYTITYTDGTTTTFNVTNGEVSQAQLDELQAQVDRYKMLENALPHITGTGTELTLNNTANAPMSMVLNPNTSQGDNPSPNNPQQVHVVSGDNTVKIGNKNLFDDIIIGQAWNGTSNTARALIYAKVNPNENYTISFGSITGIDSLNYFEKVNKDDNVLNYGTQVISQTTTRETKSGTNYIGIQINKSNITLQDVLNIKLQLEKGSTATSYEPHEEQVVNIPLGVKNLFDKSTITIGKMINKNTGNPDNDAGTNCSDYINVSKFANVILSGATISYSNGGAFYDNSKVYISGFSSTTIKNGLAIPDNAVYLRFNLLPADIDTTMLEEGTVAHSYSSYGQEPIEYCKIPDSDYKDDFVITTGKNLVQSNNLIAPVNVNTNQNLGTIDLVAGEKYYFSYDITSSSTSTRNTPFLQLTTGNKEYEAIATNYNQTAGRKVWEYNCTTSGTYIYGYWCHTPNVTVIISNIMISTTNDTEYEPYGNGKWYLKKNIGKVVLDGTETIRKESYGGNNFYYKIVISNKAYVNNNINIGNLSSHFISSRNSTTYWNNGKFSISSSGDLLIIDMNFEDVASLKTWLASNMPEFDYVLATPEYILLNDTLQEQLNTIHNMLLSYKGQTNITQENNDLPFEIVASALKDISNL